MAGPPSGPPPGPGALESEGPANPLRDALDAEPAATRLGVAEELRRRVLEAVRVSPPSALGLSEWMLHVGREFDDGLGLRSRARGVALHYNGKSAEAALHFERALAWHERRDESVEVGKVLRSLVDVYQMNGEREKAVDAGQRARVIFRMGGETQLLAQLECNLGNVYFRLDRYAEARSYYEEASRLFESCGDELGVAHAAFNLGNIETNAHEFGAAVAGYGRAKRAFQAAGLISMAADCDYSLGYLDLRRGRFTEAHRALTAAREQYLEGGKPSGPGLCDLDLCELHLRVDALRDARTHGRRAIESFGKLGMEYELGKAELMVGVAEARLGNPASAERELRGAASRFARLGNDTLAALATLHRSGIVSSGVGRGQGIKLEAVEAAARSLTESGDRFLDQIGGLAVARTQLSEGFEDLAAAGLRRLIEPGGQGAALPGGLAHVRIEGLRLLAGMEHRAGRIESAIELARQAVRGVEATLVDVGNRDARVAFFSRRQSSFAALAGLLLEFEGTDAAGEAIDLIERSRSRHLVETDGAQGVRAEGLRAARERLEVALWQQLEGTLAGTGETPLRRSQSQDPVELEHAQEELLRLEREAIADVAWSRRSPGSGPARRGAPKGSIEGIPDRGGSESPTGEGGVCAPRLGAGDLVLVYFVSGFDVHGLLLRRGEGDRGPLETLVGATLRGSLGEVRQHLARMGFFLEKATHGRGYARAHPGAIQTGLERSLTALGVLLLEPLLGKRPSRTALEGAKAITIVPYGDLHGVPFAGLRVHGAPLVEGLDVSVARSLRQLDGDLAPGHIRPRVYTLEDAPSDLPATARERDSLGVIAEPRWLPAASDEFIPDAIAEEMARGGSGILHLAAHGNFMPAHPRLSGMRLGARFLTAFDIAKASLPGWLVILSGCETGRQVIPSGEELYGPENAFFGAGAAAVVSCLWPVGDEASADRVSALVVKLAEGIDVRKALSDVQRRAAREGVPPQDWAGFLIAGDPRLRLRKGPGTAAERRS